MWVYIESEPGLFTVGHFEPEGQWHPDSDHASSHDAAQRVHWLNGGHDPDIAQAVAENFRAWQQRNPRAVDDFIASLPLFYVDPSNIKPADE